MTSLTWYIKSGGTDLCLSLSVCRSVSPHWPVSQLCGRSPELPRTNTYSHNIVHLTIYTVLSFLPFEYILMPQITYLFIAFYPGLPMLSTHTRKIRKAWSILWCNDYISAIIYVWTAWLCMLTCPLQSIATIAIPINTHAACWFSKFITVVMVAIVCVGR